MAGDKSGEKKQDCGAQRHGDAVAAIDLGSNNCRLLIARPHHSGFRVVDSFSRIVRLGEGLGRHCELSEPAMERAVAALGICARKIKQSGAGRFRAVATEACRKADNTSRFTARVAAETGIELEVIDPGEEARLALAGCTPLYDAPPAAGSYALLFDIGGGSTQITWLELRPPAGPGAPVGHRVIDYVSIPCGVVALSERFGTIEDGDGHVCMQSFETVRQYVHDFLLPFERQHEIARRIAAPGVQMVGTSGTVTTLAGVLLDLPRYERARVDGQRLSFAQIDAVRRRILALHRGARASLPCIGRERADLVVIGCAVLQAICDIWPTGGLRVADRGLREGILHGLMSASA